MWHRLHPGADPGLVLLCKWRSRISFLWNIKQAKKRLRSGLIQSKSFSKFPCGLWCANFSVISTVKLLFQSMLFEVDYRSVKVFPGWIPYIEVSNLRTFAEVFLENVSLPMSLITIACDSLMLIFFNVMPAINHTATYFAALYGF